MAACQDFCAMFVVLTIFLARFCSAQSNLYLQNYRESGTENDSQTDVGNRIWHTPTIESSFRENLRHFVEGNFEWFETILEGSSGKTDEESNPSQTNNSLMPRQNSKLIPSVQVLRLKKLYENSPEANIDVTGNMLNFSQPQFRKLLEIFSAPASWPNKPDLTDTREDAPKETLGYARKRHPSKPPENLEKISSSDETWLRKSFASVNLSIEIEDCSRMVKRPREMLSSNVTLSRDDGLLDCSNGFKLCLSLCCPLGAALIGNKCVKDNVDFDHMTQARIFICENDSQELHSFINDDYNYDWMVSRDIRKFALLEYGLLHAPDLIDGMLLGPENYCLFREPNSSRYLAKVWSPEARNSVWDKFCCICIILIMLVILICYNIVPEMNNLHGVIFQSFVVTYIASYLCVLGLDITTESKTYATWFTIFKNTAYYTGCACALWLNVMSIAIWRTFRSFRTIEKDFKEREKKRFIWYGIYAWGTPLVLVMTCVAVIHYEPNMKDIHGRTLTWWSNLGLSIVAFICNIFLYTLTAFTIRQLKKDTAHLTDGVNKHQEVAKQWLNMYVKLFVIMTGPMGGGIVPLILWLVWPTPLLTSLLYAVQLVQSILTFYVFLWKDNVKRSLRDQFSATFRRLHDFVEKSETTSTAIESRTVSTI